MLRESLLVDALHLFGSVAGPIDPHEDEVESALRAVRLHLGMEIGFISEFDGEERIFRHVDSDKEPPLLRRGDRMSMDSGYCRKIVAGELPELIVDTSMVPTALAIPETRALPIGSHMSVPIRMSDGTIYGTFCCFSSYPDTSLSVGDLQTMRAVADMVAAQVESKVLAKREGESLRARLAAALDAGQPRMVYQPIVKLTDRSVVGYEALARFDGSPEQGPDRWFADAEAVGQRTKLELAAIGNALKGATALWRHGAYLALNMSPKTVIESDLALFFEGYPLDRIVLELTEHEYVEDYDALAAGLAALRAGGMRIAVDDAGSGYASLRHVLNIRPDIIKLDISLTHGIEQDAVRQAMAAAIVRFGRHVGCKVVAEGVETEPQLECLRQLGIRFGQGYLIARPAPNEALEPLARKA